MLSDNETIKNYTIQFTVNNTTKRWIKVWLTEMNTRPVKTMLNKYISTSTLK